MMSSASKRRRLKVSFPACEGSPNGIVEEGNDKEQAPNFKYFAVCHDATQVEMRVQYEGKNIGKFTHRINPSENLLSRRVKANFLVELITHYGGRKRIKEGREYQVMNLRSLHEVFKVLPSFPETLVEFLNGYTPARTGGPVPKEYSNFINQTWSQYKDEVLRLYETRVLPTTSAHVEPDSCTDKMEIGGREAEFSKQLSSQQSEAVEIDDLTQRMKNLDLENKELRKIVADLQPSNMTLINRNMELEKIIAILQAQLHERNKTCTNLDTASKDMQVPWPEHIDKCLCEQPDITREDADRVPPEVPDVEEENFQNIPFDLPYIYKIWNSETPGSDEGYFKFMEAQNNEAGGDFAAHFE